MEPGIDPSKLIAVEAIKLRRDKAVTPIKPSKLQLTGHSATLVGDVIYCMGGFYLGSIGTNTLEERTSELVFALHVTEGVWEQLAVTMPPLCERICHRTLLIDDTLVIFGGVDRASGGRLVDGLWGFDLTLQTFMKWDVGQTALELMDNSFEYVEYTNEVVSFGGKDTQGRVVNTVNAMHMESKRWRRARTKGAPPTARSKHAACMNGSTMFVWGGEGEAYDIVHRDLSLLRVGEEPYTWSRLFHSGPVPKPNSRATIGYSKGRLYIIGGDKTTGGTVMQAFDLKKQEYCNIVQSSIVDPAALLLHGAAIPSMHKHASVVHSEDILVVGGVHLGGGYMFKFTTPPPPT